MALHHGHCARDVVGVGDRERTRGRDAHGAELHRWHVHAAAQVRSSGVHPELPGLQRKPRSVLAFDAPLRVRVEGVLPLIADLASRRREGSPIGRS